MVSSKKVLLRQMRVARPPATSAKHVGNFFEFTENAEHILNGQW
jgi:hypothetical protein